MREKGWLFIVDVPRTINHSPVPYWPVNVSLTTPYRPRPHTYRWQLYVSINLRFSSNINNCPWYSKTNYCLFIYFFKVGTRWGFYIPAISLVEWEWVVRKFTFLLFWSSARIWFKTPRSETNVSGGSHINSFQFVSWVHKVQPKTS